MAIVGAFAVPHPPMIVPAVGRGSEHMVEKTVKAYEEVGRRIAALAPDVLVITSPHAELYRDYFHIAPGVSARGDLGAFGAPQERFEVAYDQAFSSALARAAEQAGIPAGFEGERDPELDHGCMVPLHFIRAAGTDCPVVRMGPSGLGPLAHYRMGRLVERVSDELGRRAVFVASGDLSHKLRPEGPYGFAKEGPEFDRRVCELFSNGDLGGLLRLDGGFCERAAECGLRSFQVMAGALDRTPVRAELLSHEGVTGVGYGVACFEPLGAPGDAPERDFGVQYESWKAEEMGAVRAGEDPWVRLARASLEACVREDRRLVPDEGLLDDLGADQQVRRELVGTRAGCFVSIKKDGELRGCIGTTAPTRRSLAEEICSNAVAAGMRDPRFGRVLPEELDDLVYDVDVLRPPEGVSGPEELDPERYGVIVSTADGRRGLLLPALDGVDTVARQVAIAARKGGIDPSREPVEYERFEVVRHL